MPAAGQSSATRTASITASALLVFVVWLTMSGGAQAGIAFFYALPIGLATWWFGWRAGAATALACGGLYLAGIVVDPVAQPALNLTLRGVAFAAIVAVVSIARERLIVLTHSAEELELIRAALTPASLPDLPNIDAGAAFAPSELGVSGDFYLLTNGPGGSTVVVVGDAVGHGPRAARLATFIRARFAAFAANTSDPAAILELANAALHERRGRTDSLVSAVCLSYEPGESTLSWAVAGHPPPLRLPGLEELHHDGSTQLLGLEEELTLSRSSVALRPAEGVLVYTDGATDVRRDAELLGREGLTGLLAPLAELPARALASEAHRAVLEWTDAPIDDDLCLVVLRPKT